ncbi:MAG TPA: helix-turn-helix domain-containing protein [Candidatus Nanoarchaeia archaeon]|nr:helix-turn-helix domain-containing protein [Candidatus Nanoarchaeia archaeon]
MAEKYMLFNLDDEKAKKLGEIISNTTARRIVNFLAETEASESDIARQLNIPLNTVEYNINKLLEAGIIEKSRNFFWSAKGKKIDMLKVANKLIVISPKKSNIYSKLKGIVPVVLSSAVFTAFILWQKMQNAGIKAAEYLAASETQTAAATKAAKSISAGIAVPAFLIAIWIAVLIFVIVKWRKN